MLTKEIHNDVNDCLACFGSTRRSSKAFIYTHKEQQNFPLKKAVTSRIVPLANTHESPGIVQIFIHESP